MPHWLTHLGALGLFSCRRCRLFPHSSFPLPGSTDLLLLWSVAYGGDPWLLARIRYSRQPGGRLRHLEPWAQRGAKTSLLRYVPARLHSRVVRWVERHRTLAVFLPGPRASPADSAVAICACRRRYWASGAADSCLIYGAARILRYSLIAWIGVIYGRHAIRVWSTTLQKWSTPLICVLAGLFVVGGSYLWNLEGQWPSQDRCCGKTSIA